MQQLARAILIAEQTAIPIREDNGIFGPWESTMKRWIGAATVAVAVGLFAAVSWSDSVPPESPSSGSAVATTAPASGSGSSDVDLGAIPYSAMTPAEQAVIDHVRNEQGWDQTNDIFAAAGREQAVQAAAEAAAEQLGANNLPADGVVP